MNQVILIGRLVRNPELKVIPATGMSVVRFTLAADKNLTKEKKEEMQQSGRPTADFISVVVFGKMADACNNYLAKGSQVAVQGSIQSGSYEGKDGKKVYTTDVLAGKVEFLNKVEKKERPSDDFDDFSSGFEDDGFNADDVDF